MRPDQNDIAIERKQQQHWLEYQLFSNFFTYVNNAVAEKHPQEARGIGTVLLDCSGYCGFYDALRFRAPVSRVEIVHQPAGFDQTSWRQHHQRRSQQQQGHWKFNQVRLPHDDLRHMSWVKNSYSTLGDQSSEIELENKAFCPAPLVLTSSIIQLCSGSGQLSLRLLHQLLASSWKNGSATLDSREQAVVMFEALESYLLLRLALIPVETGVVQLFE